MKFNLNTLNITKQHTDCVIIGIFEKAEMTPAAEAVNELSQNYLTNLLKHGEFAGKLGQTLVLHHVPHTPFARVLLVGCGKNQPLNQRDYRKIVLNSIKALKLTKAENALTFLTDLEVEKYDLAWKIKHAAELTAEAFYNFDQYKSSKEPKPTLQEITLHVAEKKQLPECEKTLKQALSIIKGVEFTKDLANLPSNVCTPTYLALEAKKLAKHYKTISVKVLEESDMKKLGMGAFLAVTQGSAQDAKLICIEYKGTTKKQAPVALVGKGVTFDTGGISLKTADGMVGMKYDMSGAATVLGTIKAAAELKLPLHIVGLLATTENMPSGTAAKPEDIVTTLSGQTVEIMNTDAEGRLVLCDTLTYCERYKPDVVIDIATLTGAVVVALGHQVSAVLSNHDPLTKDLIEAGLESHDRVWELPLWEEYQEQLKSPFADMSNVGGRTAGAITAACFLSRFAKKFHWAHLDVAGTAAMMSGTERYATGRPVFLLMQYLINRCK